MITPLYQKEKYVVIGLMSGTSLDGLDIVCVEFINVNGDWKFDIIKSETIPFDTIILSEIKEVLGKNIIHKRDSLDIKFGKWIAKVVAEFMGTLRVDVDLISSHGQTIFHDPKNGITLQIGNGQEISNKCKTVVINNFRFQDVKLGGQGAPLVPIGDLKLFKDYPICLNLGGIANISEKMDASITAFDVCICNIGANYFAQQLGFSFDRDGDLGSKGRIISNLLDDWNNLSYFSLPPPKSLDASFYLHSMHELTLNYSKSNVVDFLRTLYEHIAFQISQKISDHNLEILVTGGGAHNRFLIGLMKEKYDLNITIPKTEIIEFKEAIIFAFMGVLKIRNEVNVLSDVTGSSRDISAGEIFRPN